MTIKNTEAGRVYELDVAEAHGISHAIQTAEEAGGAIADILLDIRADCFNLNFYGVIGERPGNAKPTMEDQQRAAYNWMKANYQRVMAAVRAAEVMAETILNTSEAISFRT